VHDGWTYALTEVDWQGPGWISTMEFKPQPRPAKPDMEVLVGLGVEDGLWVERRARADTGERELKRIMWKDPSPPKGRYYLCIRNARNEDEEPDTISRQWTHILRAQPKQRQPVKDVTSVGLVNMRLKTTRNLFDRHVNANPAWNHQRAIVGFKKLDGVHATKCGLRVEDQAGTKVRFQINAAFTYTLVVTG
jgi:hypothetical protein